MKRVFIVVVLIAATLSIHAQNGNEITTKRAKYGFSIGMNHANLLHDESLPQLASVANGPGFQLGILGEFQLSRFLFLKPRAEISFNNSSVKSLSLDGSPLTYEVMPVNAGLMTHLMVKMPRNKLSPYFFAGPEYKLPLNKPEGTAEFGTGNDLAIDFGIGFDKAFTHFIFAPELRYSYGLLNVSKDPIIQNLNFHNISMVFSFKG